MEKRKKLKSKKVTGSAVNNKIDKGAESEDDGHFKTELFTPEDFLTANPKISVLSLNLLKNIYDLTKSNERTSSLDNPLCLETEQLKTPISKSVKKKKKRQGIAVSKAEAPVPNLIVEDFDEDQIWEELELQNRLMYDNLVTSVSKLLAYQDKSLGQEKEDDSDVISMSEEDEVDDVYENEAQENIQDEDDSDFFESDEKYAKKKLQDSKQYKRSIVDDKFFSLAQMTEHIEQLEADMEREEAKRRNPQNEDDNEDAESSDEDDSIDLFEDIPSESDGNEDDKEESKKYFYEDFFDPPPAPDLDSKTKADTDVILEDDDEDELDDQAQKKSVRFEDEGESEEEDESSKINFFDEADDEEDEDIQNEDIFGKKLSQNLSTFEKKQKKIEENIQEMENKALEPKSWHLLGESAADTRPENALLEEHLIYDHLVRPAPEITAETTLKLEDVIKQRIKDGAFDDVQRKVRPVEDPKEYKKRLVLDAEKSKSSLAEIYEKEYLDQKQTEDGEQVDEKEPEEQIQIRKEMQSLFKKLDALSNFHFTPKTPTAEIKIVANTPSISVEETAATSISDANMLAPQEIEEQAKGEIKGTDERTKTDKKRERRKKKKKQHLNRLAHEEKARLKGLDLKNIKLAKGIVKSQQKAKDVAHDSYSTNQQTGKELKSSKAFFAKLQEGANAHIDRISKRKLVQKNDNQNGNLSAKRFKL